MWKTVTKNQAVLLGILFLFLANLSFALELEQDEIYRHLGSHKITHAEGLRLVYPENLEIAIPRVVEKFVKIKRNLLKKFPTRTNFNIDVILTNHDDCVEFIADTNLDILTIEVFEEMGFLSSRGYSLERRFAHKLAHILILKNLSSTSNFLGRKIGQLAVPHWFLEGMTMHYAFAMDALQHSRVIDLAKNKRLYNLRQLASIDSQPEMIQEEMMFQAHSMLAFWDEVYAQDGAIKLLRRVYKNPSNFIGLFRRSYGISLNNAFNAYVAHMYSKAAEQQKQEKETNIVQEDVGEKGYFRSYKTLNPYEKVWVSSKRYSTETYDLYYKKIGEEPKVILKNVHPILMLDKVRRNVLIGKYYVNSKKERRLGLWTVNVDTMIAKCLVRGPGSFKPLGIKDDRAFFVSQKNGITRIMSVNILSNDLEQVEYSFSPEVRPLDICMDLNCEKVYYISETYELKTKLSMLECTEFFFDKKGTDLLAFDGLISSLNYHNGALWFSGEVDGVSQLFKLNEEKASIERYTAMSGGVWEIDFVDNKVKMMTFDNGFFKLVSMPKEATSLESKPILAYEVAKYSNNIEVESKPYSSIYSTGYWLPMLGRDAQGQVIGVRTYQRDLLDRSNYEINPTFGLSSKDWGYSNVYSQQMGVSKFSMHLDRVTAQNFYLNNKYYERSIRQKFEIESPLSMASKLQFGLELIDRGIVKLEYDTTKYHTPTVGQDNSYYIKYYHKGIRTEPFARIFPRKGREIVLNYHHGTGALNGEMKYDNILLEWSEHIPLQNEYVLTCNFVMGEDSKEKGLRRPEDLFLGGRRHYLKAYPSSYKYGDRMRVLSCHLGRPIPFKFPRFMSWAYNEFTSAEVFFEMGDVISTGRFSWMYDRGVEMKSRLLFLKRLPLVVKVGCATQNGGNFRNTYTSINYEELMRLIQ